MAIEIKQTIDEQTERQKDLILQKHNLIEVIEGATAARDQLKQVEKEIAWLSGSLAALKALEDELQPKAKAAGAETGGWGKGEPVV